MRYSPMQPPSVVDVLPHPSRRQLGFKFASEFSPLFVVWIPVPVCKVRGLLSVQAHWELLNRERGTSDDALCVRASAATALDAVAL